jgi:hypothetical protein
VSALAEMTLDDQVARYRVLVATIGQAPHCDELTLHPSDRCTSCAMAKFAALHEFVIMERINHSGESIVGLLPAMDERRRPREVIERWPNNRAQAPDGPEDLRAWAHPPPPKMPRPARVSALRKAREELAELRKVDNHEAGRRAERADIVRWLRDRAPSTNAGMWADQIEAMGDRR